MSADFNNVMLALLNVKKPPESFPNFLFCGTFV